MLTCTLRIYVIGLLISYVNLAVCLSEPIRRESLFVPGILEEEMESPIQYSAYVPIIFEFKFPNSTQSDLMIGTDSENCSSTNITNGFACPVAFYLKEMMGNLSENLNPLPFFLFNSSEQENLTVQSQSVTESLLDSSCSCTKISSHFKTSTSVPMNVGNYILYLTNRCSFLRETLIHEVLEVSTSPESNPIYNKTLASFYTAYTSHLKIIDPIAARSSQTNLYTALQSIYMTNLILEKDLWESAMTSCAANNLPRTLVDQTTLLKAIKKVSETILRVGYELSISEKDLFTMYTAKLTDCAITDNKSYLVRLLVPVKRPATDFYELYRFKTVPSIYKTQFGYKLCELSDTPDVLAMKAGAGDGEFEPESVLPASCQDRLCLVSSWKDGDYIWSDRSFSCAQAMLTNHNEEVVLKFCKSQLRCSSFDVDEAPFIRQISSDSIFYSTVKDQLRARVNISIKCAHASDEIFSFNETAELLFSIGCDCYVMENSKTIFTAGRPCKEMSTGSKISLQKMKLLDDILEPRFVLPNITISMLHNLSNRMEKMEGELQRETEKSLNLLNNRGLFVILLSILIVIIFFLSLWVFQLWRWKKETLLRRSNYFVFDQSSLIQEDAAL